MRSVVRIGVPIAVPIGAIVAMVACALFAGAGCAASAAAPAERTAAAEAVTPEDCKQLRAIRATDDWCDAVCPCGGGLRCCVGLKAAQNRCLAVPEAGACPAVEAMATKPAATPAEP